MRPDRVKVDQVPPAPAPRPDDRGRRAPARGDVLALQRQAVNRAVSGVLLQRAPGDRPGKSVTVLLGEPPPPPPPPDALKRATPENRKLAELIDNLDKLGNAELLKRRGEAAAGALKRGSDQAAQQQTLDAVEYLAHRRRLGPLWVDPSGVADRRLKVRSLIEEGLTKHKARTGGSFRKALDDFTHTKEIESDIEFFEDEAKRFGKEFTRQARANADRMLDGSLNAMCDPDPRVGVLASYGIPGDSALRAARRVHRGADLDKEADQVVKAATVSKDVDAPAYVAKRKSLAMTVKDLRNHQANVAYRLKRSNLADVSREPKGDGPGWDAWRIAKAQLDTARLDLKTAWIEAEREHPILAAFRRGGNVDKVDLDSLDADVHNEMKAVVLKVLPKLVDIIKVKTLIALGQKNNGLSPVALPTVVAQTRAAMFIPDGSIRAGIVKDLVDDATDDESVWVKIAAMALAIVTLVPSGGASLGIVAGAAGASMAAYSAAQAWQKYDTQKSLANTDLDLARSLSTEEPSLTGFAMSLVSLGIEGIPLIGAFNKARRIKALLNEGKDVRPLVRELNLTGRKYNANDLGDRALADATAANKRPPRIREPDPPKKPQPVEKPTSAKETGKETKQKVSDKPPEKGGRKKQSSDPEDAAKGTPKKKQPTGPDIPPPNLSVWKWTRVQVRKAVRDEFAAVRGELPEGWDLVKEALTANGGTKNRQLLSLVDSHMGALRDPDAWADVLADAWEIAAKMPTPDFRAAVLQLMRQRGLPAPLEIGRVGTGRAFFKDYVITGRPLVDKAFAGQLHNEMTHALQDLVLDYRVGPGAGARFRKLLGEAEGSVPKFVQGNKTSTVQLSKWGRHEGPGANVTFLKNNVENETEILMGDYVWRFTYDLLYNDPALRRLPQPEKIGPILRWFFNLK